MDLRPSQPQPLEVLGDERLAELARDGSDAAFATLVARHRRALVRQCARVVGEADAEEAVQEALLRAYFALPRAGIVRHVGAWLRAIAHNTAINALRARAARPALAAGACEEQAARSDRIEVREELRDVLDAVASLPERQRDALVMRELEGCSYEEIASRLVASDGAVRQLLHRARTTLRQRLGVLPGLEPLLRWALDGGGGPGAAARLAAVSTGCALTVRVCATVLVPAAVGGGVLTTGVTQRSPKAVAVAARARTASAQAAAVSATQAAALSATRTRAPHRIATGVRTPTRTVIPIATTTVNKTQAKTTPSPRTPARERTASAPAPAPAQMHTDQPPAADLQSQHLPAAGSQPQSAPAAHEGQSGAGVGSFGSGSGSGSAAQTMPMTSHPPVQTSPGPGRSPAP